MTIPVCSAWDRLPHVAEDDPWAAGCPVSILNEASGLGWTERKTYFKWKIERWWCCSLGWDIGYPRPMDWRGICFFIQRGGKVTWNFDDLVGIRTSLVAQMVYCLSTMQETWVWFLSWEDSLEKEMATHASILAWKIPCTDRGARRAIVHGFAKSRTWLSDFFFIQGTRSHATMTVRMPQLKIPHAATKTQWSQRNT